MSLWLGSGFRHLLAMGGVPGRSRGRLEAAAMALRTMAEEGPTGGTLLDGPSAGGLFAELDLSHVLGQVLDGPGLPTQPPMPERRPFPGSRPTLSGGPDRPDPKSSPPPVTRRRESAAAPALTQARLPNAGKASRRPLVPVTPGRIMTALAPYAPVPAVAARTAGKEAQAAGKALPRRIPAVVPERPRPESGEARPPIETFAAAATASLQTGWASSSAANTRVIVSEDATAAVGGILTTVAEARGPRAPAAEVIEVGDRAERPAVRKADESSATTKGGPLLERVLQRIPANAPIGTTADVAGQEVARASEDTPPGRSVSHPPRSGFRGLADRVIQEGNRPVAPPLTPESHLSGEAVLDRMDAAIGASVSRILVREAERNGIDLAGGLS